MELALCPLLTNYSEETVKLPVECIGLQVVFCFFNFYFTFQPNCLDPDLACRSAGLKRVRLGILLWSRAWRVGH